MGFGGRGYFQLGIRTRDIYRDALDAREERVEPGDLDVRLQPYIVFTVYKRLQRCTFPFIVHQWGYNDVNRL